MFDGMWEEAEILATESDEALGLTNEVSEVIEAYVSLKFSGEDTILQEVITTSMRIALVAGVILGAARRDSDSSTVTVGLAPSELREIIESMVSQGQFSVSFVSATEEEE